MWASTVIYTDISRDGLLAGTNLPAYERLAQRQVGDHRQRQHRLAKAEITALRALGVQGAIVGKALYQAFISRRACSWPEFNMLTPANHCPADVRPTWSRAFTLRGCAMWTIPWRSPGSTTIPALMNWFYDITASFEGRPLFADALRRIGGEVFIPLTVGGSINTLEDFDRVSAQMRCRQGQRQQRRDPQPRAHRAGCRALRGSVRGAVHGCAARMRRAACSPWAAARIPGGTPWIGFALARITARARWWSTPLIPTACAAALIWRCLPLGDAVDLPLIASGGAGCQEHFLTLFGLPRVDAGLAASIFHSREVDILALKRYLSENGVPMRL